MMTFELRAAGARTYAAFVAVALGATALLAATPARADPCSDIRATFRRPHTTIPSAETVPAGPSQTPVPTVPATPPTPLPEFCRVVGFTTPTRDSHVGFEVWLPEATW